MLMILKQWLIFSLMKYQREYWKINDRKSKEEIAGEISAAEVVKLDIELVGSKNRSGAKMMEVIENYSIILVWRQKTGSLWSNHLVLW